MITKSVRTKKYLKPCPFCGSSLIKIGDTAKDKLTSGFAVPERIIVVQCRKCSTAAGFYRTRVMGVAGARNAAINLWNTRAGEGEE